MIDIDVAAKSISGNKRLVRQGTKWCGQSKINEFSFNVGYFKELDQCCRIHDDCPLRINNKKQRWGVINKSGYTLMNCKCDDQFYTCLKQIAHGNVESLLSTAVGTMYFNGLKTPCIDISVQADLDEQEVDINGQPIENPTAALKKAQCFTDDS